MKRIGLLFCLFITSFSLLAQQPAKIKMNGRAQRNQILLRWAPDEAPAWKLSNQYGYRLERYTVIRDRKMLKKPEKVILATALKPRPLPEWDNLIVKDSIAAIVAYAIHGQTFDISVNDSPVAKTIAKSQELEQRYIFALAAAERNFDAAVYAGWGIADTAVKPNEKYLYRIFSLVPKEQQIIDSSSVFIGLADYQLLPKPSDVTATFKDRQVTLIWNDYIFRDFYVAYHIERSSDGGKIFQRLTKAPFFNANERDANNPSNRTYFKDSLENNTTIYQYRIVGVTAFGETGPPSDAIVGKGKTALDFAPNITSTSINNDGELELEWEIDEDMVKLVKGFRLNHADNDKGPYEVVIDKIPSTQRKLTYKKLGASNYFTISAYTVDNEAKTSFPVLVQPPDGTPPAPPVDLTGKIDSNGVVRFSWKANTEPDFLGYRIFKKNNLNDDFIPITDSIYKYAAYTDTISLKVLNNKIYYALISIDKRFNESDFSQTLELKKPDKIAPNVPVLTDYKVTDKSIYLAWAPSSDKDLSAYMLYRKDEGTDWKLLKEIKDATSYSDPDVKSNKTYQYYLISKDEAGLLSAPSKIIELSPLPNTSSEIKELNTYVDRAKRYIQLFWSANLTDVEEYYIYKSEGDNPISLLTIVPATQKQYVDERLKINTSYKYAIKALLKSGEVSRLKEIQVSY